MTTAPALTTYLTTLDTGMSTRIVMVRAYSQDGAKLASIAKTGKVGEWKCTELNAIDDVFAVDVGLDDAAGRRSLAGLIVEADT